jgi:hypothetical protein
MEADEVGLTRDGILTTSTVSCGLRTVFTHVMLQIVSSSIPKMCELK